MKQGPEIFRFRGTPSRLLTAVEYAGKVPPPQSCRVTLAGRTALPLFVRRLRSEEPLMSVMSFRLPKSTPPGIYQGRVELGEQQIPIEVEVEPRTILRFLRPALFRRIKRGARITEELVLVNRGNVTIEIPKEDRFCVFDESGVARAIYRGLVEEDGDGEQRIDRVMDELAKSHGGLVRVTVSEGWGALAPEEVRTLKVEFHFSGRLIANRTYRGTWSVSEASLDVKVEVTRESEGEEKTNELR